jgi:hypothetical protein
VTASRRSPAADDLDAIAAKLNHRPRRVGHPRRGAAAARAGLVAARVATSVAGDDYDLHGRQFPIARLHHTKTTGLWTLYWRDRNLKFHRYQPLDPSPRVRELLDYLDKHADPIFWG